MREERIYTLEQLQALIPVYQKRMRLTQWDIEVCLADYETILPQYATIVYEISSHYAKISISTPETAMCSKTYPFDMKHILIHEMLHLILPFIEDFQDLKYDIMELGLNRIAEIMIDIFEDPPLTSEQEAAKKMFEQITTTTQGE